MKRIWFYLAISLAATSALALSRGAGSWETNARRPVVVDPGQGFAITLRSSRSAGYQWRMITAPDDGVIRAVANLYQPPMDGVPGASGKEFWTFDAVGPGRATILMSYRPPTGVRRLPGITRAFKITVPDKPVVLNTSGPISAEAGLGFAITLESNHTTGYGWQLAGKPNTRIVRFLNTNYVEPNTRLAGAGGKEIWTFEALAPGKTSIVLNYVRPWEKNTPPARTKTIVVVVK